MRLLASVAALALHTAPVLPTTGGVPVQELRALVDSVIGARMAAEHIRGAAFVMVEDGRVTYARGYGVSDLDRGRPVDPDTTLFRIGSITKVFTATALMQLADAGRISLDEDVNRYLTSVRVPGTYPQPVTARHLLSHMGGFDEIRPGTQAESEAAVVPLREFLRTRLVRVRPPGEVPAYSTYGISLAALIVEDVTGQPFEEYLKEHVLAPLGMQRSGITLPPALHAELAPGYEYLDHRHVKQPYEWYHTASASSLSATPTDMARFMIAHLGNGAIGGSRILSGRSARAMRQPNGRGHPDVPGVALGFFEGDLFGARIVEHGGTVAGTSSGMVLLPDHGAGFFVVGHVEGSTLRDALREAIVRRFFARAAPPHPSRRWEPAAQAFAGRYRWNVYCHSCGRPAPQQGPTVSVNEDGTLTFAGQRWVRTGPLLFRRVDGARVLGFRQDPTGRVTHLFIDGPLTFERITP
ncbi:MAG TPA: serine hydrolase domain-containing protein [Gemmatimonadales bacterium]|nr:serine hydrolase domain-containing protein [Gemmatimonadales bacterium]